MDYRSPLQHLLQKMMPAQASPAGPSEDFEDTRPDDSHSRPPAAVAARNLTSSLDPFPGTEIMEYPDAAAAELLEEFFADSLKRAA